ncbi:zinc-ribbon domain-containing protein, partial [Mariniblastus sp.]|nr:zinc-ribbon domain-containing protein [Mariniblastus sp.]
MAKTKKTLEESHPEIAAQFLSSESGLTPRDVSAGSNKRFTWKCPKGEDHIWSAVIADRAKGRGCPVCTGRKVVKSNCLNTTHPEIAKQFLSSEDGATPNTVTHGSKKKFKWKCEEGDDHIWRATVNNRTNGSTCPICSGDKAVASNCLATTHPDLAKQFLSSKNGRTPRTVTAGSNLKFRWKCQRGDDHIWEAQVYLRANYGQSCPFCTGNRTAKSNKLSTTHPEIAKQFLSSEDGATPDTVSHGSKKKFKWKCEKGDDHIWTAT